MLVHKSIDQKIHKNMITFFLPASSIPFVLVMHRQALQRKQLKPMYAQQHAQQQIQRPCQENLK